MSRKNTKHTKGQTPEQIFFEQKEVKDKQIDSMLDRISLGLNDLKTLAEDMNVTLATSNEMLNEMDGQMDKVNAKFKTSNKKITHILKD